jgi:hypothetical protein
MPGVAPRGLGPDGATLAIRKVMGRNEEGAQNGR